MPESISFHMLSKVRDTISYPIASLKCEKVMYKGFICNKKDPECYNQGRHHMNLLS